MTKAAATLISRFETPLFLKLVLGLFWWMIHLFLSIHQLVSHLLQVIESYIISIGLLESYRHFQLDKLRCLAVVVDSKEARNTQKIKKLLRWLSDTGLNYVILYDMEGVLKKSLDGDLSEFTSGGTSVLHKDRMVIELLSFNDNEGIAKAASFLCTKYLEEQLASSNKMDPSITETEMFDALNAVGCGGPEPNLLLVFGPVRCHLGFPAWRLRYTEIVHMGSLKSMKYGAILKALCEFSKKHQNYGT
ncbi:dehydrodolichyl diphosphate synthase complex subunit NUS1 isoform X2 [Phalaenopsis equestris]|uniref:dehydrodolichyl diphosphate synthase complex subunit NUS1 isoform X2 n=1 Tax=Phalaenopsis equestris TaxID=78828 RepID=UPI0009E52F5A|nr:dehydrodolichyl diphosphate synthase complex subunit NUS1 isoform X2 [Phalaenopsis equestris]